MNTQQRTQTSSDEVEVQYFDLHTRGFGYLNRVRWVQPSRGGRRAEEFLACEVNALHGNTSEPSYTKFDLKVSGKDAIELVDRFAADVEAERKVLVWFTIGDVWAHSYMRDELDRDRRRTGKQEAAAVIKGRLLRIARVKVDGVLVYEAEKPDDADQSDEESLAESQSEPEVPPSRSRQEAGEAPSQRSLSGRPQVDGVARSRGERQGGYERRTGTHG